MKKIILRTILLILIILTCLIIFEFSSQNANDSKEVSGKITEKIVSIFYNVKLDKNRVESIVRKIAHYFIYTLLGIEIMSFVSTFTIKEFDRISFALIAGMIYAMIDEIHQAFVSGRGALITDVMLDTLGVITGIFISLLIIKLYKIIKLIK